MTGICDFNSIWWEDPLDRWLWEAMCGGGGMFLMVLVIVIFVIFLLKKIFE